MSTRTVATVFAAVAASMTLVFVTYVVAETVIQNDTPVEFPMTDAQ
jgi:hypothetical protein